MARDTVRTQKDEWWATDNYQPTPYVGPDISRPEAPPTSAIGTATRPQRAKEKPAVNHQPQRKAAKSRLDEWMEVDFKFGGSRIKRKAVALVLLGVPAGLPLF